MAAGRAAAGDLDLATERAMLARSQRHGQDIKNNVAMGTYAPIDLLSDVLANAAQAVVDRLEQIPADLRRVCPDLPQAARDAVMAEIASARNEMARKTASLVADALDPTDLQEDDEPTVEEVDA
jgi:phage terminase Nu1 subunit (DNA packaging protein)